MAEDKKPKITLEEIANSSAKYSFLGEMAKDSYSDKVNNLYSYFQSIGADYEGIRSARQYETNPYNYSKDVEALHKYARKATIENAKTGLPIILDKLDQGISTKLALKYIDDKKYLALADAMQSDDKKTIAELVSKNYLERNKNNREILELAKTWNMGSWISYAEYEMRTIQNNFALKNLYTEKEVEKDGERVKIPVYDASKTKSFIEKSIGKLKNKEQENAYLEIGALAHAIYSREVEEKKKKEEK